jgi:hypothetical protein
VITREQIPSPKEVVLHIAVAGFLDRFLAAGWAFTHVPAGEKRDARTAAKLKAMGTKPGWPDLIFVSPEGFFHGLELKREGEKLSEEQEAFHAGARARGWRVAIADSLESAIVVLKGWGCLRINVEAF